MINPEKLLWRRAVLRVSGYEMAQGSVAFIAPRSPTDEQATGLFVPEECPAECLSGLDAKRVIVEIGNYRIETTDLQPSYGETSEDSQTSSHRRAHCCFHFTGTKAFIENILADTPVP